MALVESTQPADTVLTEVEGIKFLYQKDQAHHFENMQLDFQKAMFGGGNYRIIES